MGQDNLEDIAEQRAGGCLYRLVQIVTFPTIIIPMIMEWNINQRKKPKIKKKLEALLEEVEKIINKRGIEFINDRIPDEDNS